MKVTVDIPPHLEKKLRGALPDDMEGARKLLLETLTPTVEALLTPPRLPDDQFAALADELAHGLESYAPGRPPLADAAVSRKGLYKDHL